MENYEYEYIVNNVSNEELYHKQCEAIEKHFPGINKLNEVMDVDSSRLQKYLYNGKVICVINDYYLNDVHVESEIPIEPSILISRGV